MRFGRHITKKLRYMIFVGVGVFIYCQLFSGSHVQDVSRQVLDMVEKKQNKDPNVNQMGLNYPVTDSEEEITEQPDYAQGGEPAIGHFGVSKKYGPVQYLTPGRRGNYEPPDIPVRHGPGENGAPVYTSLEEKAEVDRSLMYDAFNMPASNKIAMNRSIPDSRLDECKYWQYPPEDELPSASVVVIFYDEGLSPLLRTVHSIVNMSPKKLLKEVVMVDDFSEREEFQPPNGYLYTYMRERFGDLVKIYRTEKREGLIRARNFGAAHSVGDVVVFLDSHCECNRNWLVPLLARIAYDRTILAVPIVDIISGDTFRYTPYGQTHNRGIFEWGFLYKEGSVPERELKKRKHVSEPYWSPTHAGGLLAIERKFFLEIGGYDPGLRIWGGENYEIAFKIWQCGGSTEWVPCSRVGHVYRSNAGRRVGFKSGVKNETAPLHLMNYKRVVEVWFDDEYKEYFYRMLPEIRKVDVGDLSPLLAFKKKYNCQSFKWFIENIAYDIPKRYPYPPPLVGWGAISTVSTNQCFDIADYNAGRIMVYRCHNAGGQQLFRFNTEGQIANGEHMVVTDSKDKLFMKMTMGSQTGPWQLKNPFEDRLVNRQSIYHKQKGKCVQVVGSDLMLRECDPNNESQRWFIKEVHPWKKAYTKE